MRATVGLVGERSALADALFWAERIGSEVFAEDVRAAEIDAIGGWPEVERWSREVTYTEVAPWAWAAFWLGTGPVPGWPDDGAEGARWAHHVPSLGAQRGLAIRILGRRVHRAHAAGAAIKSAFLRSIKALPDADRAASIRAQFYASLRAAGTEHEVGRPGLGVTHINAVATLPASEREPALRRHARPTVKKLRALKRDR